MANVTGFNSSNTLIQCIDCGRLTWGFKAQTEGVNGEACADCARVGEQENEHNDYGTHQFTNGAACPICHPARTVARRAKVAAHNATIQIKAESYAADKAAAKAAKAAKAASIKRCADCKDGRASSTSDFCSVCRPYHPHAATKLPKRDREYFAAMGMDITVCACGLPITDKLHQG